MLKRNIVANYFGQGWRALMSLAFIPVYIKYLGIESYGLIGIYAILQAWLALLDIGMKPALSREMARFTGGANDVQSIRDLLRTIEIIGAGIAACVAFGIWVTSYWLASSWLKVETLPVDIVSWVFTVMGVVTALRFIEDIYVNSMAGLQRQVLQNILAGIMATVRSLGAVGVLIYISPTITAFFIWQGLVSLITVAVYVGAVYRALPSSTRNARFSWPALLGIWRFAAGMMTIAFLSFLLTQVDKILLSRLLPLKAFSYYALAGVAAGALYMLSIPINSAFYPRFTELVARNNWGDLRRTYHQASQLVTVLMGTAAIVLVAFGDKVLLLWTGNSALAGQVAPLLAVLAVGTLLNGLMSTPYQLQLAYGWTSLTIQINVVAVSVLLPLLLWVVPRYGAIGAAWAWVILNCAYLFFAIALMHRRLLTSEKWRWYRQDVALPLSAGVLAAGLCRWAAPNELGMLPELAVLIASSGSVLIAAALVAPVTRHEIRRRLRCAAKQVNMGQA